MDKKKILIVGFGGIGCRHAQSFLGKKNFEVHIVEPKDLNIQKNLKIIGAKKDSFKWYKSIRNIPVLDLAIIATSSQPRFEIIKSLIKAGYKRFLLEKIVFQSEEQFYKAIEMVKNSGTKVYCNFVHRYYIPYENIKKELNKSLDSINMEVTGSAFELGMGCNAIHYIDLFQYLTGLDDVKLKNYDIRLLQEENRRGSMYKEFYGVLELTNNKKNLITIITDLNRNDGISIKISQGEKSYLLNQKTQKILNTGNKQSCLNEFKIIPTSHLTYNIVNDIFNGNCRMTQLNQTLLAHSTLFYAFNTFFFNKHNKNILCPIT